MRPRKIILEDTSWYGRGFFSSLNLILFALYWCKENGIDASVGETPLRLYTHPISRKLTKRRPFSSFYGNHLSTDGKHEQVFLDDIWTRGIQEVDAESQVVIEALHSVNEVLRSHMLRHVSQFTSSGPSHWPTFYDATLHYRGCDYLANTPKHHIPNLRPEDFLDAVLPLIENKERVFVATDDSRFIGLLKKRRPDIFSFKRVARGLPGKGTHQKTRLQRYGIEWPRSPFYRGLQAMRDCTHLSKTDTYIGTNSNLAYHAKILRPSLQVINLSKQFVKTN